MIPHTRLLPHDIILHFPALINQRQRRMTQQHPIAPRRTPRLHICSRPRHALLKRVARRERHRILKQLVLKRLQLPIVLLQLQNPKINTVRHPRTETDIPTTRHSPRTLPGARGGWTPSSRPSTPTRSLRYGTGSSSSPSPSGWERASLLTLPLVSGNGNRIQHILESNL